MRRKQRQAIKDAELFAEQEAHRERVRADFSAAREDYINGGTTEAFDAAFIDWAWIQPMTPLKSMILVLARTYSDATLDRRKYGHATEGGLG